MSETKRLIALDCGNSSYRMVLGTYVNGTLSMEVLAQEENAMTRMNGIYYWDTVKIYQFLIRNLKKCIFQGIRPDSIGICAWGVDFAFFDKDGFSLGETLSYRNTMGQRILDRLSAKQQEDLFYKTGILCDRINSVYLMKALQEIMPVRTQSASRLLMLPDIFNYLLTGKMVNEPSELSTTQLMSARTQQLDVEVCERFGIPASWFSAIGRHGRAIGDLQPSVKEELGITGPLPVICVPSHDTASAVAAIPAQEDSFLFISSGTWSLIGTELSAPIITKEALESRFTNEVGAFGKITLLKNCTGMYILSRMKQEYEDETGQSSSWQNFLNLAEQTDEDHVIDVNDERFFNPAHISQSIHEALKKHDPDIPYRFPALIDAVQRSMAKNYAKTLYDLERVTKNAYDRVYLVGGGVRNTAINQMTADYSKKTVIACGAESTCLGNLGTQLNYFFPDLDLKKIRETIRRSIDMVKFQPAAA
jgi:rhamnulokinase